MAEQRASRDLELVALGVAAEVVMVVEQEDAGLRGGLAVEPGGRKPTHAGAHDHEVVGRLGGVEDRAPVGLTVESEGMSRFERAAMAAAQTGQGRWVGGRRRCRGRARGRSIACRKEPEAHDRRAVEQVAARDGSVHTQLAVTPSRHASPLLLGTTC